MKTLWIFACMMKDIVEVICNLRKEKDYEHLCLCFRDLDSKEIENVKGLWVIVEK
jgi:hypothetical protein